MFEHSAGACAMSVPLATSTHAFPRVHDRSEQSLPCQPSKQSHRLSESHMPWPEHRLGHCARAPTASSVTRTSRAMKAPRRSSGRGGMFGPLSDIMIIRPPAPRVSSPAGANSESGRAKLRQFMPNSGGRRVPPGQHSRRAAREVAGSPPECVPWEPAIRLDPRVCIGAHRIAPLAPTRPAHSEPGCTFRRRRRSW